MSLEQTEANLVKEGKEEPTATGDVKYVGVNPIEQLELQVGDDQEDIEEINKLLFQILLYPNSQLAELHQEANRLGNRDEEGNKEEVQGQAQFCPCCGYAKQDDPIKLCHKLDDINNLGISTFLYFQTLKNLAIILIEMILIYSIYALATNIIASGKFDECGTTVSYRECSSSLDYLAISLGSKQQNQTDENKEYYLIQAWIGVVMVIVWFLTFFALKYFEKAKEIQVDGETISASDFSIVIENITDDFTEKELQEQLTKYEESITSIPQTFRRPLTIRKFNKGKPFYLNETEFNDEELIEMQEKQKEMINMFAEWIIERQDSRSFSTNKEQREEQYKLYEELLQNQQKKLQELSEKVQKALHEKEDEKITVAFVTLDTNYAKNMITTLNPADISARVRNFITCGTISNRLELTHNDRTLDIRVERAPEPEDIVWANIGITDGEKLKRKLITYTVTVCILGASFGAVYGLSTAQINNSDNRYLSTLISLIITLINVLISQVIRRLSIYERDFTTIKHQTSLAIKSVLAQLINSIVVPIIANYFIKSNLYDKNGLADDIFMLGLTNAFVAPILKYFDLYYLFTRIMAWYYNRPNNKLYINQVDLNAYFINIEFEIGFEYIYIVNMFLFTCFFVSLQPIIAGFALVGFFLMYWAQKWSVFNRTRRPVPGNDLINSAMGQLIFLGPLIYSLGSLTWSNFFPGGIPKEALVPNLVALVISIIFLVFPLSLIFSCFFDENPEPELKYDDNRIYFPTEYDRLNPATSEEGFKDYMKYVEGFQDKVKNASKEEQEKLAKQLERNSKRGSNTGGNRPQLPFAPGMQSLFAPPPRVNTHMLGQQLLPGMMPRQQAPMVMPMAFKPMNLMPQKVPVQQSGFQAPPPQQMPNIQPMQSGFQQPPPQQSMFQQPPQQSMFRPPQQQGFGFQPQMQPGFGFRPQMPGFQAPPGQFNPFMK